MMVRRCDRCKVKIENDYMRVECTDKDMRKDSVWQVHTTRLIDLCPVCTLDFERFLFAEDKPHED